MGASEADSGRGDFAELSDEELVRKYCTDGQNPHIFSELWSRHERAVRRAVRRAVFCEGFCPAGWDRDAFADSALSRAQLYCFRRLCSFLDFRSSFRTWLAILTRSSVLDEYHYLRKFREVPDSAALDSESNHAPADADGVSGSAPFRSEYLEYVSKSAVQETSASAEQRKRIVLRLLIAHANQSDESLDSAHTIRLRYWRDWTLARLGRRLYGPPRNDRDKNRQEQAVRRLLLEDYEKLHATLQETFGISSLRQI